MKVRYHLQRGPNYKQWQFRHNDTVWYHDPAYRPIVIKNCRLKNNRRTAERIYNGENKSVCAWVNFDSMELLEPGKKIEGMTKVNDNPKEAPFWRVNGQNADGCRFEELVLTGDGVFLYS